MAVSFVIGTPAAHGLLLQGVAAGMGGEKTETCDAGAKLLRYAPLPPICVLPRVHSIICMPRGQLSNCTIHVLLLSLHLRHTKILISHDWSISGYIIYTCLRPVLLSD